MRLCSSGHLRFMGIVLSTLIVPVALPAQDALTVETPQESSAAAIEGLDEKASSPQLSDSTQTAAPSVDREDAIQRLRADLSYFASDQLEGRNVGTEGIAKAGEFVAKRFADLGLEVDSFDGTAYQEFTIPGPAELGEPERNFLTIEGTDYSQQFELEKTLNALSLGNSGKFEGELVFAGYGISAPDLGYDDYKNVDVEGKVVVVLRKEPQQNDEESIFEGRRSSQYAYFSTKEVTAAFKKAAALIIVNDSITAEDGDSLIPVTGAGKALTDQQIPTLTCTRAAMNAVVMAAVGKSLAELEKQIDENLDPQSQVLTGFVAKGETHVRQSEIPVRNVVGVLPGRGSLEKEYVIIGAHYDHVGMGGPGSLAPGTIAVHNGADDNASGTITMLEVARRLSLQNDADRRSIVFMAFTGEEKGLLGSKYYCRNPRWPIEDTVAMLNMDMVGRLSKNSLTVYGVGTAEEFEPLVDELNTAAKFELDKRKAGFGPSDHSSFYEKEIPVFHFFTGLHNDYHRPSDDVELVNFDGMERIASFVTSAATRIAVMPERPKYLRTSLMANIGNGPSRRGPRAVIGVELNLEYEGSGAAIRRVANGGPASDAGLKDGDVVKRVADRDINTIQDLRRAMSRRKPGDDVKLLIQRGEDELEVELVLGEG